MDFEFKVTKECNLYKLVRDKFGKEKKENYLPNPYGATALREWGNGIFLVRRAEITGELTDRLAVPDEMKDFIQEVKSACMSGVHTLPRVNYKGKDYIVDFRLGELRDPKTAQPIRFKDMSEGVDSPIKKELRGLRSRTSAMDYLQGLDD